MKVKTSGIQKFQKLEIDRLSKRLCRLSEFLSLLAEDLHLFNGKIEVTNSGDIRISEIPALSLLSIRRRLESTFCTEALDMRYVSKNSLMAFERTDGMTDPVLIHLYPKA